MTEMGYKRSKFDHSVFYKKTEDEHTIVAVATDDMAVISKRMEHAKRFKAEIAKHWEITDHRPIKCYWAFKYSAIENDSGKPASIHREDSKEVFTSHQENVP